MKHARLCLVVMCGLSALNVATPTVRAGGKDAKVEFSHRMIPTEPELKTPEFKMDIPIYLRPNTNQGVELFVKNTETDKQEDALKEINVQLVRVDGGKETPLATAKLDKDKLLPGDRARLQFALEKPWVGTSAKLQLHFDAKGKKTFKQDVKIQYEPPDRYLQVEKATFNRQTGRISFLVSLKPTFVGPPCVVELVCDRAYIPGLKTLKDKSTEVPLTKIGQALEVFADLEFDGPTGAPGEARVFLNVDGYKRAFEFEPNFNDIGGQIRAAQFANNLAVRFRTPRYLPPPDKKNPLIIDLEIDGQPIDQPARVEMAFNRSEDNKDDEKFEIQGGVLQGLRDVKLVIEAGKKGELLCKMTVVDHKVQIDAAQVTGQRWLRLRALDEKGKALLPVSKEALKPLEAGRAGTAKLSLEKDQVFAPVTFDDTPVEGIKFIDMPPDWTAGKDIKVKVAIKPRLPANRYAPIERAIFFFGKPGDKIAEDDRYLGTEKDGVWSAVMPTPEKAGKLPVTVVFETLTKRATTESDVVLLKIRKKGEVVTTLKGKVTDTAERPWGDVTVKLNDDKGKTKAEKKSDAKGLFVFEKVAPGEYTLEASRAIPGLKGTAAVTVPPDTDVVEKDVQVKSK